MRHDVELVLVDDGSSDATWDEFTRLRAEPAPCDIMLERHDVNRGLGAALRTGCARATGQIIVTLDADGTYPFTIIEPLVAGILAGADVVTASPYHRDGGVAGVSPTRLVFSRGASAIYRVLVDRRVATYTAMVRAYRASVLRAAISDSDGFLHVAMTLVEARRRGALIDEVPAVLAQRQVGVSKAKVFRITRAHLRYMAHLAGLRATGHFRIAPPAPDGLSGAELASHG
jgi:dolichol-phosphate mannosyltransferase